MFPNKDWKRNALKVLTDTTGTVDRRPDSGQPHTVCTTATVSYTHLTLPTKRIV